MSQPFTPIVLAAGEGKRMKSPLPKVLHPAAGVPMIDRVLGALRQAGGRDPIVVVGHGAEAVRAHLGPSVRTAFQDRQLGTGHAVRVTESLRGAMAPVVVVACGDTPLLTPGLFAKLLAAHAAEGNAATVLSFVPASAGAYGRIVRGGAGEVLRIVEFKDATEAEKSISEVNSGIYAFSTDILFSALERLKNENAQGEYYLTDTLEIIRGDGGRVGATVAENPEDVLGVNTPEELAAATAILAKRALGTGL